jgi:hypothetical protein
MALLSQYFPINNATSSIAPSNRWVWNSPVTRTNFIHCLDRECDVVLCNLLANWMLTWQSYDYFFLVSSPIIYIYIYISQRTSHAVYIYIWQYTLHTFHIWQYSYKSIQIHTKFIQVQMSRASINEHIQSIQVWKRSYNSLGRRRRRRRWRRDKPVNSF